MEFETAINDVIREVSPKVQRKAMRGAMRSEANNIKKAVVARIKTTAGGKKSLPLTHSGGGIEKTLLTRVYPDKYGLGFMVTVKPHGKKGYYKSRQNANRSGKKRGGAQQGEKPILMFAEEGTKSRNVGRRVGHYVMNKGRFAIKAHRDYQRSGHSTGEMPAYHFLPATEQEQSQGIEERLWRKFEQNLDKSIKKLK